MKIKNLLFVLLISLVAVPPLYAEKTREERVHEHLTEFASPELKAIYPKIGQALEHVLLNLPEREFNLVTDRKHPTLFINTISSGIARFANAKEFTFREDDLPAFQEGFFLILLGDEMNNVGSVEAISGVIAHEIAHNTLNHLSDDRHTCEKEREANQTIKKWGFAEEFAKASKELGSKNKGDSPCYEYFKNLKENEQSQ